MIVMNLNGEVGEGFSAASVQRELRAGGPARVILNSGGGLASEGVAIYNSFLDHDADVDFEIAGIAASAASIIAMAGRKITMRAGAVMMIHDPSVGTLGNAADHAKAIEVLETVAGAFADIYSARTGKAAAECRRLMKAETWYDGEAAVAAGFATASSRRHAVAFAKYDYSEYRHSTEAFASIKRKQDEAALDPRAIEFALARWGEVAAFLPDYPGYEAMATLMFKEGVPVAQIADILAAGKKDGAKRTAAKAAEMSEPPGGYRLAGSFLQQRIPAAANHGWGEVIKRRNSRR